VQPVWEAIAGRARTLGLVVAQTAVTSDPDLYVMAGSRRIGPAEQDGGRYRFILPDAAIPARLISRVAVPHEVHPWIEDQRPLGVRVTRLSVTADGNVVPVALDGPMLTEGWWAVESDGRHIARWTNGNAALPLVTDGVAVLEIEIERGIGYPMAEERAKARAA
jgi:hypothetical protein